MKKKPVRPILDIALTLLLGGQMAYSLIGEKYHELAGLIMLALLIGHHVLNGGFHRALLRGRYTPFRAALTALDALMLAVFVLQGLSGLMMARYARVLPGMKGTSWARRVHLAGAYWGFVLCGAHAGLHMTALPRRWLGVQSPACKALLAALALALAGLGVAALVRRGLPDYMTLRRQFVFFDPSAPLALFFLDYACILALCMELGCALGSALQRIGGRNPT